MSDDQRQPGWDAKAIQQIVAAHYAGRLAELFEVHGWPERGTAMMPAQQGHIKKLYGSIEAFVRAHEHGISGNAILDPLAAINAEPPDVWLTSYYGFNPESWGFLGFTAKWMQERFIKDSRPGALVVIYGTGMAVEHERGRVLGIQQQSHRTGTKWDFLPAPRAEEERTDPRRGERWVHAVQAVRAWKIPRETQPPVRDFAPDTFSNGNATIIGSRGLRMSRAEANRLLSLELFEVPVFGGGHVEAHFPVPARQALSPSRPGPVSQSSYMVREAEGPKHLYVLRLEGNGAHFLGRDPAGGLIIKVGFSVSPDVRREAHQRALPEGAFWWRIYHSTFEEGREAFPSSRHALAGEQTMIRLLDSAGKSLGGEFFLADEAAIKRAWREGIAAAEAVG